MNPVDRESLVYTFPPSRAYKAHLEFNGMAPDNKFNSVPSKLSEPEPSSGYIGGLFNSLGNLFNSALQLGLNNRQITVEVEDDPTKMPIRTPKPFPSPIQSEP